MALTPGVADAATPELLAQYSLDAVVRPTADRDLTLDRVAGGLPLATAPGSLGIAPDGRFGGALAAAPANVDPLSTGTARDRLMPERVTLLAWIRSSDRAPGEQVIAGQAWDARTCGNHAYALLRGAGAAPSVRFAVRLPDGTTVTSPLSGTGDRLWDGAWHAVAGTFDGSTVRFYLDGAEAGSGTAVAGDPRVLGYGERNGAFGIDGFLGPTACRAGADFVGGLDEVRVYDEALTAVQVRQLANAPGPRPPELGDPDPLPPVPPPVPPPGPGPGPGPGPDSGPGTVTVPPPAPPAPPVARFEAAARISAKHRVVLDAGASTGVERFRWDFDGDGKTDLESEADAPAVRLVLPRAKTTTVKLTVVGAGGATSSRVQKLVVAGSDLPPVVAAAVPAVAASGRLEAMMDVQRTCMPVTVAFRLVEAFGCLSRHERFEDAPESERDVMRRHYEADNVRSPQVIAAICKQVELGKLPPSRCEDAKQRFSRSNEFYVARGPVRLSGITITPQAGSAVVVFPMLERVVASRATMRWGGMTVHAGAVDLDLAAGGGVRRLGKQATSGPDFPTGSAELLSFDGRRDLPSIGGFTVDGRVSLSIEAVDGQRTSAGTLNLQLPPAFTAFGGRPPSASTTLRASNADEPQLDRLSLTVPEAYVGPVRFTDMSFAYSRAGGIDGDRNPGTSCDRRQWKARGNVFLTGGKDGATGFRLTAPPSQNGIGFCGGAFQHAGGALTFGGPIPRPVLFPGVHLDEINFALQLDPVLVRGGGQISVADLSTVRGALLMAFPSPTQPYVLSAADAGGEFRALAGKRFTSPTVAVGGEVAMNVPKLGRINFGHGALMYSYPDYVYFGGGVRVVVPGMAITGSLTGEAAVRQGLFQVSGAVSACLGGISVGCVGASAYLGSKGMSACLDVAGLHPGAGYAWGASWPKIWLFDGCKPSQFWTVINRSRTAGGRAVPALPARITVAPGEPVKHLELTGAGGAPRVLVRAPDGKTLTVSDDGFRHEHGMAAIRIPEGNATFVGLKAGPGTYTIEPLAGSPSMTGIAASRKGYDSSYSATVSGRGTGRVLHYDVGRQTGQSVTFVERGSNVMRRIGTARRGRGTIRFVPAPGAAGSREIVAIATLDGVPIPEQRVARYRASGIGAASRVGSVTVRRRGAVLRVGWKAAPGATAYGVTVRQADGRQRRYRLGAQVRRLRVAGVSTAYGGSVAVTARGALRDWGPTRQKRFRATKRPFTVLQTARFNHRTAARAKERRRTSGRASLPSVR